MLFNQAPEMNWIGNLGKTGEMMTTMGALEEMGGVAEIMAEAMIMMEALGGDSEGEAAATVIVASPNSMIVQTVEVVAVEEAAMQSKAMEAASQLKNVVLDSPVSTYQKNSAGKLVLERISELQAMNLQLLVVSET
jgi:hypothetical protein